MAAHIGEGGGACCDDELLQTSLQGFGRQTRQSKAGVEPVSNGMKGSVIVVANQGQNMLGYPKSASPRVIGNHLSKFGLDECSG